MSKIIREKITRVARVFPPFFERLTNLIVKITHFIDVNLICKFEIKNVDLKIYSVKDGMVRIFCDIECNGVEVVGIVRSVHIDKAYLENRSKQFNFVLGKDVNKDVSIIWSENDIASKVKSSVYNANLYFADYSYQSCIEYLKNNLIECWGNAERLSGCSECRLDKQSAKTKKEK